MALHSEVPDQIMEGPDGPAVLAAELWGRALEHRADQDGGRFLYMLSVSPADSEEIQETSWTEIKSDQVAELAEDAMTNGGAGLAWKMVVQLHNLQMRHWSGMAAVFEKLGQAGNMQIEAVKGAITAQREGAMLALEAERAEYDIKRDELEMQGYMSMFQQWLQHMQQAKAMNSDGPTITAPATIVDAAGALHDSLTLGQMNALSELLGADEARDITGALERAAKATAEAEASAIVRTILMKLAPYQQELARLFAPPIVPPNIAAFQNACLQVLARAGALH